MLTQTQLETLLNRPLTSTEVTNLNLYLEITEQRLSQILCLNFATGNATRAYETRSGYRTVFTDPFTGTPAVTINGNVIDPTEYSVRQGDSLNGSWHNSIVFKKHLARTIDTISVTADYGFGETMPADLQHFVARTFAEVSRIVTASDTPAISSKKIEDYSVTYDNSNSYDNFISSNQGVIDKYGLCNLGQVRHGYVRAIY